MWHYIDHEKVILFTVPELNWKADRGALCLISAGPCLPGDSAFAALHMSGNDLGGGTVRFDLGLTSPNSSAV